MGWSSGMTRVHVKVQDLYDHKLNMSQHYYSVAKKKKKKKFYFGTMLIYIQHHQRKLNTQVWRTVPEYGHRL